MRELLEHIIKESEKKMTDEEVIQDTKKHMAKVKKFILKLVEELKDRAENHDKSKLEEPELAYFIKGTPKLNGLSYGTEEYNKSLEELKPGIEHHHKNNRHHPEYFENGIKGMNLVDLIELICDWKAASLRHNDGDVRKSLETNKKRFNYSEDLKQILSNTIDELEKE
jgi:protein associated with RNAse G/E